MKRVQLFWPQVELDSLFSVLQFHRYSPGGRVMFSWLNPVKFVPLTLFKGELVWFSCQMPVEFIHRDMLDILNISEVELQVKDMFLAMVV